MTGPEATQDGHGPAAPDTGGSGPPALRVARRSWRAG